MKISVIIPVFNAQDYLERCIDSILNQTLSEIEVICIDDCSTDNSYDIIKKYAEKDDRIISLKNEKNIGQGLIRNIGIDIAKGEYISFVDCDDWIELNMFEKLYEVTNVKKYDVIGANFFCDFSDGKVAIPNLEDVEKFDKQFLVAECITASVKYFSPNPPWGKLYKREYINKIGLRFESERVLMYEDKFFNISLFMTNPDIFYIKDPYYHYIIRSGSTMTSYRKKFRERYFLMDDRIKALLNENNLLNAEISSRLQLSLFEMTFAFFLNTLIFNKSLKFKIAEFLEILKDKRITANVKHFTKNDIPESSSKLNALVKYFCFFIIKYLK